MGGPGDILCGHGVMIEVTDTKTSNEDKLL